MENDGYLHIVIQMVGWVAFFNYPPLLIVKCFLDSLWSSLTSLWTYHGSSNRDVNWGSYYLNLQTINLFSLVVRPFNTGVHGAQVENHFHISGSCYSNKAPTLSKQLPVAGMNLGFYKLLYLDWMEVDFRVLKVCIEREYVKLKFVHFHRIREE